MHKSLSGVGTTIWRIWRWLEHFLGKRSEELALGGMSQTS